MDLIERDKNRNGWNKNVCGVANPKDPKDQGHLVHCIPSHLLHLDNPSDHRNGTST